MPCGEHPELRLELSQLTLLADHRCVRLLALGRARVRRRAGHACGIIG
jgi:hypothetical protein